MLHPIQKFVRIWRDPVAVVWSKIKTEMCGEKSYLIYPSTEYEVAFLIPFQSKYRPFVLAQGTGEIT